VRHIAARNGWFAIVADNGWAAEQAVKAANPRFTGNGSPAGQRTLFQDALDSGVTDRSIDRGDYDGIVRGSRPLAATYWAAPSLHLGLEPLTATARVSGEQVEVWAPTQAPDLAARLADSMLYPMPVGEPAGRAMENDLVPIAVELARTLRVPVQVTLPQAASQNYDRGSLGALARMTALPGQGGITSAWQMRVATGDGFGSAIARLIGAGEPSTLGEAALDGAVPPYAIPDMRIEGVRVPANAGYMRGSPQREYCFFTESFVDELAHAAGLEPLAFRMSMLGGNPRLARCLQGAAQLAQWDGGGRGSSMGIAGCSAFGSHIALVANATIGDDQRIKVHRLAAAVDCGRIVNSGLVTQQIAGGLLWAMAQATVPAPEWVAGMPRARPFAALGLPRIGDTPDISVQLLANDQPPGGVSGLGTTVLAPAVANAIYAATGRRLRDLPFDLMAAP
jgi:isoquinoline 1-oxidoreductase beta subunit